VMAQPSVWSVQPPRTSSADPSNERVILFTSPLPPLALWSPYVTLRFLVCCWQY
jgi:hypothetical protein